MEIKPPRLFYGEIKEIFGEFEATARLLYVVPDGEDKETVEKQILLEHREAKLDPAENSDGLYWFDGCAHTGFEVSKEITVDQYKVLKEFIPRHARYALPEEINTMWPELHKFLSDHHIAQDVTLYGKDAWLLRLESVGLGAEATLVFEGPLYRVMNYPENEHDRKLQRGVYDILDKHGLTTEMGYAWSLHFYDKVDNV